MTFQAKKAQRQRRPLKVSMAGLSGGGKTYTALRMAFDMRRHGVGSRIIVLDSENESAGLYAGVRQDGEVWDYDTADIPQEKRTPAGYTEAYAWAVGQGYDIVIVDSLSHAWHGVLNAVDEYAKSHRGDKLGGWADMTPQQQRMLQVLTDPRAHCFTTMRVKSDFQDQDVNGKTRKVKVGLKADQRDNTEYEYDLVLRFEAGNEVYVEKVRGCEGMNGRAATRPGPDFWKPLIDWWLLGAAYESPEDAARKAFAAAKTVQELAAAWMPLPDAVKIRVLADKDRRKAELQAGQAPAGGTNHAPASAPAPNPPPPRMPDGSIPRAVEEAYDPSDPDAGASAGGLSPEELRRADLHDAIEELAADTGIDPAATLRLHSRQILAQRPGEPIPPVDRLTADQMEHLLSFMRDATRQAGELFDRGETGRPAAETLKH